MAEVTQSTWRGVATEDPRITLWRDESSGLTEAGPRPGRPVPGRSTRLKLDSSGSMEVGAEDLDLQTQRGGLPGGRCPATYIWKRGNEADDLWRTHWPPHLITNETVAIEVGSSGPGSLDVDQIIPGQSVTLEDGTVVTSWFLEGTDAGLPAYRMGVTILDPTTHTPSHVIVDGSIVTSNIGQGPGLAVTDEGDLRLFRWTIDDNALIQADMHYSTDQGTTWARGATGVLRGDWPQVTRGTSSGQIIPLRLRAANYQGQLVLLAHIRVSAVDCNSAAAPYSATMDRTIQFASSDGGHCCEMVSDEDLVEGGHLLGAYPDVVATPDGFLVAYVDSPGQAGQSRRLASMDTRLDLVQEVEPPLNVEGLGEFEVHGTYTSTGRMTIGETALVVADNDEILWYAQALLSGGGTDNWWGLVLRSRDLGASWAVMGEGDNSPGYGTWNQFGHEDTRLKYLSGAWSQGRVVMACSSVTSTGDEDGALRLLALGGAVTVELPRLDLTDGFDKVVTWRRNGLPLDEFGSLTSFPYSRNASGGGVTEAVDGEAADFQTTTIAHLYYDLALAAELEPIIRRFALAVEQGGSTSSRRIYISARADDGAEGYEADVRLSASAVALWDVVAGTQIGTDFAIDVSAGVQVLLALVPDGAGGCTAAAWTCARSFAPDLVFELVAAGDLTDDAGSVGNGVLEFGHRTGGIIDAISHWYGWGDAYGELAGPGIPSDFTNPDDLHGRPFTIEPHLVDDEIGIQAGAGETLAGDYWTVPVEYDFSLDNLLTDSPAEEWRATGTSSVSIAFRIDGGVGDPVGWGSPLLSLALLRCNAPRCLVEVHDGGGWTSMGTAEFTDNRTGLAFLRSGDTVFVDTGSSSTTEPVLRPGELRDGYAILGSSHCALVATNQAGKWTDSTHARPQVRLAAVPSGAPGSGSAKLYVRDNFISILPGIEIQGVRLTFATAAGFPAPPEGYWKAGRVLIGPYTGFPDPWDWGWQYGLDHGSSLQRLRNGYATSKVNAAPTRSFSFGWPNGLFLRADDIESNPDYGLLGDASSNPILWGITLPLMEELLRTTDGPAAPLVVVRHLEQQDNSLQVIDRPHLWIYGRMETDILAEHVVGNEQLGGEFVRLVRATVSEEP